MFRKENSVLISKIFNGVVLFVGVYYFNWSMVNVFFYFVFETFCIFMLDYIQSYSYMKLRKWSTGKIRKYLIGELFVFVLFALVLSSFVYYLYDPLKDTLDMSFGYSSFIQIVIALLLSYSVKYIFEKRDIIEKTQGKKDYSNFDYSLNDIKKEWITRLKLILIMLFFVPIFSDFVQGSVLNLAFMYIFGNIIFEVFQQRKK